MNLSPGSGLPSPDAGQVDRDRDGLAAQDPFVDVDAAVQPDRGDERRDDHGGQRPPDERPDDDRDREDEQRPSRKQPAPGSVAIE